MHLVADLPSDADDVAIAARAVAAGVVVRPISTQYLGEIERGRRDPSLSVAARLATALDSSLDFLALGEADSPAGIVSAWSRIPEELRSLALRILWALSERDERAARSEQRPA